MNRLTLQEVIDAIGGRTAQTGAVGAVTGISTDSRSVTSGDLFFAIKGDRFDGHDYLQQVCQADAMAAVVELSRLCDLHDNLSPNGTVLIGVDDPVAALGRLAAYYRKTLPATVIGVVGSNGKTTTKSMIDHVLSGRMRGYCSPKSFNNAIGVPLTLLSAGASHEYVVAEIGTNAPGEVAALTKIVQPDIVVLTSIGEEHLEGLGDLAGVIREECSVFEKMETGFAAVNIDQEIVRHHLPQKRVTLVTFGTSPEADLRVSEVSYDYPLLKFKVNERFAYRLPMPGLHNATNALGAIAVARRLGFEHDEAADRLGSFAPPNMRCEVIRVDGMTIINDAYNANPPSMLAAIEMLETQPSDGRRVMVVGEMRELGDHREYWHEKVGQRLARSRLDQVVLVGCVGELITQPGNGVAFARVDSVQDCADWLKTNLADGDTVLLKGSRGVGLERVIVCLDSESEEVKV